MFKMKAGFVAGKWLHFNFKSLKNNILNGAVLDVFKNEPLNKSNVLWELNNTYITPHIAGITNATIYAANNFIKNIEALENKSEIKNKVSLIKEY